MNQNENLDLKIGLQEDLKTTQTFVKKNAKVYSKKALSVLLAAVMLLTMCSVAFGLNATAATSVLTELAQAIVSDTVLDLVGKSEENKVTYVAPTLSTDVITTSIYAEEYSDYVALVNIANLVMSEADYLVRQANGYTSTLDYDKQSVSGENMASIHVELSKQLEALLGDDLYEQYDVDTVLNVIFYGWDTEYGGGVSAITYGGTAGYDKALSGYYSGGYNPLTFNLTITTDDYVGALNYSTANALKYASLELVTTYKVTMTRVSDDTDDSCSSGTIRAWVFDDSGDIANVNGGTGTTSTADDTMVDAANAYAALMEEMIVTYPDFKTIYELSLVDSVAIDNAYTTITDARTVLAKTLVEGTTNAAETAYTLISKMYANGTLYATCIENFEAVEKAELFAEVSMDYNEFSAEKTDYGTFSPLGFEGGEELIADYTYFTTYYYDVLNSSTDSAYEYFVETFELDEEYYVTFGYNVDAYKVSAMQAAIEEVMDTYGDVDPNTLDEDVKSAIYTTLDTNLTNIAKYDSFIYDQFISEEQLAAYYDMEAVYETEVNAYVSWFYDMLAADFKDYETDELLEIFTGSSSTYSTKLSGLNAFYNKIVASAGTDTADTLLASLIESANGLYDTGVYYIASIFEGQVEFAYDKYDTLGDTSNLDWSVSLYIELRSTIGLIETDIYDNLKSDGVYVSYVDGEVQEHYATLLADLVPYYEAYAETLGFDTYEASSVTYVARETYTTDVVKEEAYEVESTDMTAIIDLVDSLLADEDILNLVADLLGLDIAEGETLDLANLIIDLLADLLCSDSIVNVVVQLLYPLVGDNFNGIALPAIYTHDDYGDLVLNYEMTMEEIAASGSEPLAITPAALATFISQDDYPEAYEALASAGSWTSSKIYDSSTDSLTLVWGLDAASAAIDAAIADGTYDEELHGTKLDIFIETMGDALEGIFPFLDALLCGDEWASDLIEKIATTTATATIVITTTVDVTIDLYLGASANDGYVNVLGAIYELLGYYDYMSATEVDDYVNNAKDIVQMLFDDVTGLIDYIFEAPLENILDVLPGLVYALTFDMIPQLLELLETTIWYSAPYDAGIGGTGTALSDTMYINVGEMLDLADMGIDTTQGLTGFLDLLGVDLTIDEGLIATLADKTTVETKRTALIYTGTADGYAYHLEADTEGVLYYVLTFILDAVKGGEIYEIIEDVMALFGEDDYDVSGIEDIITDLGFGDGYVKTTDMIAAVVELMSPVKYDEAEYFILSSVSKEDKYIVLYEGEYIEISMETIEAQGITDYITVPYGYNYDETTGEVTDSKDDLYSSEYWTEENAEYLLENLPTSIDTILALFGIDLTAVLGEEVSVLLEDLLASLYTTGTVDSIIELVNTYIGEYLTDETITMIVDIVVDLDLIDDIDVEGIFAHIQNLEYTAFEDGDRDGFVVAIVELLEPLVPVLKLFLVEDSSITAYTTADEDGVESSAIEVYSYNGYESAILPILEALGCDAEDMVDYDTFAALSDAEMVKAILNPILGLLDSVLSEELFYKLFDIVPNILYFVESNALNTALNNLLRPVYAVLDTIRPIYNLSFTVDFDIMDMVDGLIAGLGIEGYIDLSVSELLAAVLDYGVTEERTSVTGETYNYLVINEMYYSEIFSTVLYDLAESVTALESIDPYINIVIALTDFLPDSEFVTELTELLEAFNGLESTDQVLFLVYHMVTGFENLTDEAAALITEPMEEVLELIGGFTASQYAEIAEATSDLVSDLGNKLEDWGFVEEGEGAATVSFFTSIIDWFKSFFEMLASVFGL